MGHIYFGILFRNKKTTTAPVLSFVVAVVLHDTFRSSVYVVAAAWVRQSVQQTGQTEQACRFKWGCGAQGIRPGIYHNIIHY